ncbi:MAG: hypothetical protein MJY82_10260 [Fibrobacter sp.]|nr:hypothetical protein [Fibrobacter sp.]
MKKIITIVAVFGLAMAFTACGDDSSSNPGPNMGPKNNADNKACLISYSDGSKRCNMGTSAVMFCGGTGSSDGVSFTSEAVADCPAGENVKCADTDGSLSYFYDATMTECPSWLQPAAN